MPTIIMEDLTDFQPQINYETVEDNDVVDATDKTVEVFQTQQHYPWRLHKYKLTYRLDNGYTIDKDSEKVEHKEIIMYLHSIDAATAALEVERQGIPDGLTLVSIEPVMSWENTNDDY